jgi:PAS domain S-box-containing protein
MGAAGMSGGIAAEQEEKQALWEAWDDPCVGRLGWPLAGKASPDDVSLQNSLMKLFFEMPLIGIAVTCPRTKRWIFFNERLCQILGYCREELAEASWPDLTHPHDLQKDLAHFDRVMAGQTDGYSMDKRFIRKDGGVVWARIDVRAVRKPDGTLAFFVALVQDIGDRKRLEDERIEMERKLLASHKLESLGHFAGAVGNDLNNYLLTILGQAELLALEMAPTSPGRGNLLEIVESARGASRLCHDVLLFRGTGTSNTLDVDVSGLIDDISKLLGSCVGKRSVLRYDLARGLPIVKGDPDQIRQIVLNAVTNAAESTAGKRCTVTVSTSARYHDRSELDRLILGRAMPEGTYVSIVVSDNGSGMDESIRNRLFEPYFSTKFGARGLGMAVAMGFMRAHGGAVVIQSEVGEGTTVRFLFPSFPVTDPAETRENAVQQSSKGTVLLIDDDAQVLSVARRMLERLGFSVLTAGGGMEALDVFRSRREQIDCILLDMTMPDLDGEETLLALRRSNPEVRVILSSGYGYDGGEITRRFKGKGPAVRFLPKPYGMAELAEAIRRTIQKQELNADEGS